MKQVNVYFEHMKHDNAKNKNGGGSGPGGRMTAAEKIKQRRLQDMFGAMPGQRVM